MTFLFGFIVGMMLGGLVAFGTFAIVSMARDDDGWAE